MHFSKVIVKGEASSVSFFLFVLAFIPPDGGQAKTETRSRK